MHHSCGCGASFRRKISGSSHYGKIVIGYLYPITIEDFLFGWRDSYVPEI